MALLREKIKIYWSLVRGFTLIAPFVGILSGALVALSAMDIPFGFYTVVRIFLVASGASALNGASNVINQYYDVEIDKINKPFRPLIQGQITKKETLVFAVILYILANTMAIAGSSVPVQTGLIFFAASLLTVIYSAPPLRTKRLTLASNLTIAVARGLLLIVAGWSAVHPAFEPEPWLLGMVFGVFIFFTATTKDLVDIEGDKKGGIKTIPVLYGEKVARQFISAGMITPFLLLFLMGWIHVLKANPAVIEALAAILLVWGLYVVHIMKRNSQTPSAWRHMYLIMIAFQVGLVFAYILS